MGEVIISLDAELAWGYRDRESRPARISDARAGWTAALDLLERYNIPSTWAVVGQLLLEPGSTEAETWYSSTDEPLPWNPSDDLELWHAPELIEEIRSRPQPHEIASHTFSHVIFSDDVPRSVAKQEFRTAAAVAARMGLDLNSVVYPRNYISHRDVLNEEGFVCYRGTRPPWYRTSKLRPLLKLADWSPLGSAPPVFQPEIDSYGLVNVPGSLYLYSFEGLPRHLADHVGIDPLLTVAKRGVDKAVNRDGVFHAWLHPHNLCLPGGRDRLEAFLEYVDQRRQETALSVTTMGDVAQKTLEADAPNATDP